MNPRFTLSAGWIVLIVMLIAILAGLCIYLDVNLNDSDILQWLRTTQDDTVSQTFESGSTTIRNVGLVIAAAAALIIAIWRGQVAESQAEVARQDLLNERYQKGAEMLGSEILAVRLAGIYELQRLAEQNHERYYLQVLNLLCAFARFPIKDEYIDADLFIDDDGEPRHPILRQDVQAIMSMFRRRDEELKAFEEKNEVEIDLRGADLRNSDLAGVNFSGVNLRVSKLHEADLKYADLSKADLSFASLNHAKLLETCLSDTALLRTDVTGTVFYPNSYDAASGLGSVRGLTQEALDEAVCHYSFHPYLRGARDAQTGCLLEWNGRSLYPED